jgi:hypothetical protein
MDQLSEQLIGTVDNRCGHQGRWEREEVGERREMRIPLLSWALCTLSQNYLILQSYFAPALV